MTLTSLLILAVCRTRIMHELRSGPCPPQSLLGSVVKRWSAESEDLRSDSHGDSEFFLCLTLVTRRKKNCFLYFFSGLEIQPSFLFYLLPCGYFPNNSEGLCIRCFMEKKPNFLLLEGRRF